MKKLVIFVLALAFALPAYAECTKATAVTAAASVTAVPANDVEGGRSYLLVQNIGANPAYCAIGSTATSSNGFLLAATGGSIFMAASAGPSGVFKSAPNAAVNCISTGGNTVIESCTY